MADIRVNFVHPTNENVITVKLDNSLTVEEVIGNLIANDFVEEGQYNLAFKGGDILAEPSKTLVECNVINDKTLRVLPTITAG